MVYKVYLREGHDCQLVSTDSADSWPVAINTGDERVIIMDGEEVRCIVDELGNPCFVGRSIISQDIFVRRQRPTESRGDGNA